jgi:hypothetical protein
MFADTLQLMLGTRVIDETHSKTTLRWRDHGVMGKTPLSPDQLRQFLDHVSGQTSLDIRVSKKPMDVWYVLAGPASQSN